MSLLVRVPAVLFCFAWLAISDDACPKASMAASNGTPELSWTSGTGRIGADRICTRLAMSRQNADAPLPVAWPAAGIISAEIGARFTSSFCCFESATTEMSTLHYGNGLGSVETHVHSGVEAEGDEYPDLIEDDARTKRSSFVGKLWDGSKFLDVDVEFRASASYAHLNQSVFQFVTIDRSSQPVVLEWNLLKDLSKTMQPYYSRGAEGAARQEIYVFFAKKRPSPAEGIVELKTAGGKLLGRFGADGFLPGN